MKLALYQSTPEAVIKQDILLQFTLVNSHTSSEGGNIIASA